MFSSQNSQVSSAANYIEDVFSTYLYTGNGSTQTITNGIDLAGKGGLTWIKYRDGIFGSGHFLYDTVRGAGKALQSNLTNAETAADSRFTSFNSNGFSLAVAGGSALNASTYNYASWTFREQPKFFDVVTYTGTGSVQNISHNLGSVPGCIIVKSTASGYWSVYHRSTGSDKYLELNVTGAVNTNVNYWDNTSPTSTQFTVKSADVNASGDTFVAYLFAHNAGGFGLTGTDNVISCGSFTADGAGKATVTLGYEPQWFIVKSSNNASSWSIVDNMRGMPVGSADAYLNAESSAAEATYEFVSPTATGMDFFGLTSGWSYIYIAIRRGPMKTPTTGTSVFSPLTRTGTRAAGSVTGIGFPPDSLMTLNRTPGGYNREWNNKIIGPSKYLRPSSVGSELTSTDLKSYDQDGVSFNATDFNSIVNNTVPLIQYFFRRSPKFFDNVALVNGVNSYTHNLNVAPELIFAKSRDSTVDWIVYHKNIANPNNNYLRLNTSGIVSFFSNAWATTATTFNVDYTLWSGGSFGLSFLFATCDGVSKVGGYTGNGSSQTIACGFAAGARFVMIKRTDDVGDWYVWDTARGIVSGNDPYLSINTTAAEVTTDDTIDPDNSGFIVNQVAATNVNVSSATYIFLAIA